jgi:hypothetical protein
LPGPRAWKDYSLWRRNIPTVKAVAGRDLPPRRIEPTKSGFAGAGGECSIAAKADTEYLFDQPYEDKAKVRVAGPFTVKSLSPHRVPAVDIDGSPFDPPGVAEAPVQHLGPDGERPTPERNLSLLRFAVMSG